MPGGRPSDYTIDIAAEILNRIADGRSVRSICTDEDMPAKSTVFKWLMLHKEFADQYARACDQRAEAIFEETLEIADDSARDYMDTENGPVFNQEHVQRARLRVDTRKWFVSKLAPKKYGEHKQVEHSGSVTLGNLVEELWKGRSEKPKDSAQSLH